MFKTRSDSRKPIRLPIRMQWFDSHKLDENILSEPSCPRYDTLVGHPTTHYQNGLRWIEVGEVIISARCKRVKNPLDGNYMIIQYLLWRHQMETFSALLALWKVTRSFDVFLDLRLKNDWVNNRDAGDARRQCAHYDVTVMQASGLLTFWVRAKSYGQLLKLMLKIHLSEILVDVHMMTSSNGNIFVLLALIAANSTVAGEFPAQRPVTRSFDVFFGLCLNLQLNKQSWGSWFETLSHSLWRHCNEKFVYLLSRKNHLKISTGPLSIIQTRIELIWWPISADERSAPKLPTNAKH